ncbi:unnamed protein product [Periconia digitata]|uniref:FAD-binding PCMH-type domain-containing protein n=1 Tax=Periconia digitata TaxID=1303443 RepID=A0A9W4U2P6_9PLEO|nr:unnamed protein product [Periconia digitata]
MRYSLEKVCVGFYILFPQKHKIHPPTYILSIPHKPSETKINNTMFLPPSTHPLITLITLTLFTSTTTTAQNFPFEAIQLTEADTLTNPSLRFGNATNPLLPSNPCKTTPEDPDWPTEAEWSSFNNTLDGALLKPAPLASPCYEGPDYNAARCASLKSGWGNMALHANHPISVCSQWATGDACVPTSSPNSTCSQGGYPVYVVNATTVRHVQMAVNFARNKNIRVVVKNSGHDYNGRNIGAHSLGIWVHNLKGTAYHANFQTSDYTGRAVAVGGGTQAADVYPIRTTYNTTIMLPGGSTVGVAGGYAQGGGHSSYSSIYGLTADNVLRIYAVTADGRFVTADSETNADLFWAFRGGGPGNFGIVTSMLIAAFPNTPSTSRSITFSTLPSRPGSSAPSLDTETFWEGVKAYWGFCIAICEEGGLGYNFIRHGSSGGRTGLTFTTSISLPFHSSSETRDFLQPLLDQLDELGISSSAALSETSEEPASPPPPQDEPYASALGEQIHNTLLASRLFLTPNFATPSALSETNLAIRTFVEKGGYDFHGQNYNPSTATQAYSTQNAVLPAFRSAIMHAQGYLPSQHWDGTSPQLEPAEQAAQHKRLQEFMQGWRDITPGSGSYVNEGDAQSALWKEEFFGGNYERLEGVKGKVDPWGVFWVLGGVGSDGWEVRGGVGGGRDGLYTQDGVLCRVE